MDYTFFFAPWIRIAESATHLGAGLVGYDNDAVQQTPAPWPSWSTPNPLGHLGRGGRCSGLSDSPTISSGHCWRGSESLGRTADRCQQISGPSMESITYWETQPTVWNWYRRSSRWYWFRSIMKEWCTYCTCCYLSRLAYNTQLGGSSPAVEICLARASLQWWIWPWMTLGYGNPCMPTQGWTKSATRKDSPPTFGKPFCARGR